MVCAGYISLVSSLDLWLRSCVVRCRLLRIQSEMMQCRSGTNRFPLQGKQRHPRDSCFVYEPIITPEDWVACFPFPYVNVSLVTATLVNPDGNFIKLRLRLIAWFLCLLPHGRSVSHYLPHSVLHEGTGPCGWS
jgi:hypothetical protein